MPHVATGAGSPGSGAGGQRVGVVGLGTIGGGIAVSLARRGRIPAVHDLRPEAGQGLSGVPAPLRSAADVARTSDVVFVSVVDAAQVQGRRRGCRWDLGRGPSRPGRSRDGDGSRPGHPRPGRFLRLAGGRPPRLRRESRQQSGEQRAAAVRRRARRRGPPSQARTRRHRATGDALRPVGDGDGDEARVPGRHRRPLASGARSRGACVGRGRRPPNVGRGSRGLRSRWQLAAALAAAENVGQHRWTSSPGRYGTTARNLDKDLEAVQELAAESGVAVPLVDLARAHAADTFGWVEQAGE